MWQTVNISIPVPDKIYLFYDDQNGKEFIDFGDTQYHYTYFMQLNDSNTSS